MLAVLYVRTLIWYPCNRTNTKGNNNRRGNIHNCPLQDATAFSNFSIL